jgi:hypothetical protein
MSSRPYESTRYEETTGWVGGGVFVHGRELRAR